MSVNYWSDLAYYAAQHCTEAIYRATIHIYEPWQHRWLYQHEVVYSVWGLKWEIMKKCSTSCGCSSSIIFREWERQAWRKILHSRWCKKACELRFFLEKYTQKMHNCGDHMQLQYARKSSVDVHMIAVNSVALQIFFRIYFYTYLFIACYQYVIE